LFNKKEFAQVLKGLLTILSYGQIEKKKKKSSQKESMKNVKAMCMGKRKKKLI